MSYTLPRHKWSPDELLYEIIPMLQACTYNYCNYSYLLCFRFDKDFKPIERSFSGDTINYMVDSGVEDPDLSSILDHLDNIDNKNWDEPKKSSENAKIALNACKWASSNVREIFVKPQSEF